MDSRKIPDKNSLTQEIRLVVHERDVYLRRLKELNAIGIALSTERNPKNLFNLILRKSREITSSDAGSLYLVEDDQEGGRQLRFKILQNDSMEMVKYEESAIPMTRESISGNVAITGKPLRIPDVYKISPGSEYSFNSQLDEITGYRTVSNMTIPMQNHRGEIIGGIQLINRKRDFTTKLTRENYLQEVLPFEQDDEELASSLASQAAVALENILLIRSIETLFEGFVTAAVTAIESRDPTTSGHSFRVADLTVALAS
jgi:GAF domain-containing protein